MECARQRRQVPLLLPWDRKASGSVQCAVCRCRCVRVRVRVGVWLRRHATRLGKLFARDTRDMLRIAHWRVKLIVLGPNGRKLLRRGTYRKLGVEERV